MGETPLSTTTDGFDVTVSVVAFPGSREEVMAQPEVHMLVLSSPPLELLPCLDERTRLIFLSYQRIQLHAPSWEWQKEDKIHRGSVSRAHTRPPV